MVTVQVTKKELNRLLDFLRNGRQKVERVDRGKGHSLVFNYYLNGVLFGEITSGGCNVFYPTDEAARDAHKLVM